MMALLVLAEFFRSASGEPSASLSPTAEPPLTPTLAPTTSPTDTTTTPSPTPNPTPNPTPSPSIDLPDCAYDDDWTQDPTSGLCYKQFDIGDETSLEDGWYHCEEKCNDYSEYGATMLCIQDEHQQSFLETFLANPTWTGYTETARTQQWSWFDGCHSGYTNWADDCETRATWRGTFRSCEPKMRGQVGDTHAAFCGPLANTKGCGSPVADNDGWYEMGLRNSEYEEPSHVKPHCACQTGAAPSVSPTATPMPTATAYPTPRVSIYWGYLYDDDWDDSAYVAQILITALLATLVGCCNCAYLFVNRKVVCDCCAQNNNGITVMPLPHTTGAAWAPEVEGGANVGVQQAAAIPMNVAPTQMMEVMLPDNAVEGGTMMMQGPDGNPFTITIPPGVKPGSTMSVMVPSPVSNMPMVQAVETLPGQLNQSVDAGFGAGEVAGMGTAVVTQGTASGDDSSTTCGCHFGGPGAQNPNQCVTIYGWVVISLSIFVPILWAATCGFNCIHWFVIAAIKYALLFVFVWAFTRKVQPQMRENWNVLICAVGTFVLFISLCCCFDANSTVWRRDALTNTTVQVPLHTLSLGDEVLSLDPLTRKPYFEPVLAKAHYSFFDGGYQLSPMRTLWLEDLERDRAQDGWKATSFSHSITLSHTHFIYVLQGDAASTNSSAGAGAEVDEQKSMEPLPVLLHAQDVKAGDCLIYYDVVTSQAVPLRVVHVEEGVQRIKRAFFMASPYVLVNNISASPYMGLDPAVASYQHTFFSFVSSRAPHPALTQLFVTATTIPFLLANNALQSALQVTGSFIRLTGR